MNQPLQQVVIVENRSNGLGLAGLIFSCIGWLTCGLLCIPGALLSFFGLFSKPRGTAIAGLIVGFPGVLFFVFAGMTMLAGFLGLGVAATGVATGAVDQAREAARRAQQNQATVESSDQTTVQSVTNDSIEPTNSTQDSSDSGIIETVDPSVTETSDPKPVEPIAPVVVIPELPSESVPSELKPEPESKPDPKTIVRTFSDATGKFKVEAKVTGYKSGMVRLERTDNGKSITIELKKLSESDQKWLSENFGQD